LPRVYLTFDVEDTINDPSFHALQIVLELLKMANLKGLFFITGAMGSKLIDSKDIVSMLAEHEIGYHSSSHSVRPAIFEYTDVPDYQEAIQVSLEREASRINPLTGRIEGRGGLCSLRELFPDKKILSFRSPGFCWSPPHLEALKKLGIRYDFSTNLSLKKITFNGITFYPFPWMMVPPEGGRPLASSAQRYLFRHILSNRMTVFGMHPQSLVNAEPWDSIYFHGNPVSLTRVKQKTREEVRKCILDFARFLMELSFLHKMGIIDVSTLLELTNQHLQLSENVISNSYHTAMDWPIRFFDYHPKFLRLHFSKFFGYNS